jgi:autophagy-related protein 5
MMARQSYLHIGLKDAVKRMHKFAPTVLSISNSVVREEPGPGEETEESNSSSTPTTTMTETKKAAEYPVCWFEDEESQIALRWHLFAGILWDMRRKPKTLPWKIRLHFSQYPTSQILPLEQQRGDALTVVERSYKNSLKQALFLQYGTPKVAMGLSKQSFEQVWDAILAVNCKLYDQVDDELQGLSNLLPVRLLIDSKPPIQRPVKLEDDLSLGTLLVAWAPSLFQNTETGVEPATPEIQWSIQGLRIPLSAIMKDLWKSLSHPDHFLYLVVTSK